ncbi:MAG TPA: hypothetical protein VFB04_13620 [Terriglobales bacterium]|nr:hypothetical protein [Terriglobales bacterium]
MKSRVIKAVSLAVAILVLGAASLLSAQDQINLGDGLFNAHFNGNGTAVLSLVIPAIYCNGTGCFLANGAASGTGHLQGNGSYVIYSSSNAPFFLTHNPDDSFTVTQNSQVNFTYTSPQGTLSGLLSFGTMSKTNGSLRSTLNASLTNATGSFAQYFANGGNVTFSIGLTFPLQTLYQFHGFAAVEFENGVVTPAGNCTPLTQGYWKNHQSAWKDGSGLTLGTNFYTNAQLENIFNTPVQGDASVDLAHQLIAALLNIANGTTSLPIQTTLADANNLIGSGIIPENIAPSSPTGQQMEGDATILNSYNNGQITNGCGQ